MGSERTIITIALLVVVMILGMANAVNVTAIYDSDENNNVSPCESCSRYQANGTFSEERANDTHAGNVSLGSITNLTGSVCDDEVLMKVNITSPVRINESMVDLSVTNDNTTVATAVIRDSAVINGTASTALASSAFDHGNISTYTGAGTCMVPGCHGSVGENFTMSIHNTWQGIATNITGKEGNMTGKRVAVNEFCGAITSNEAMCGKCHAGYGLIEHNFSVDKIDCLICHAPNYNKTATGPGPLVNATAAAQGVELPTREYCLRCHATAGGGDNRKRGDLELVMGESNVSSDLDVHMSANMTCQECHTFEDHHVSGRGMDLRVDDTDTIVSCEGCHNVSEPPHPEGSMYNKHIDRIACTSCHITSYGTVEPVEVACNWERPFLSGMLTKESNATPIHVWWNRTSEIMGLADPAVRDSDGNVVMAKPGGDINDSDSKIYAARLHLGRSPWNGTYNAAVQRSDCQGN